MDLFTEQELQDYVSYWGGNLEILKVPDYKRGRAPSAVTFYALHHPVGLPQHGFWMHTIKQAVTFMWDWLHTYKGGDVGLFRTPECRAYFQQLLDGYVAVYSAIEVFKFRYQNWYVVDCQTMIDQLWTVQQMIRE